MPTARITLGLNTARFRGLARPPLQIEREREQLYENAGRAAGAKRAGEAAAATLDRVARAVRDLGRCGDRIALGDAEHLDPESSGEARGSSVEECGHEVGDRVLPARSAARARPSGPRSRKAQSLSASRHWT
jgi:hypothetical protein